MRSDELDYKLWRFITRNLLNFIIIVLAAIAIVAIVLKLSNRPIVIENPPVQPTQPTSRPTPTALPTPLQPQINQNIYNGSVIVNDNYGNFEVNYYNQAQASMPLPSPTPLLLPSPTPPPPPPLPTPAENKRCVPANAYHSASEDCGSCKPGDMRYEARGGCRDLFCKTLYGRATAWSYEEALAMAKLALENARINPSCEGEPVVVEQKEFEEKGRKCFYILLEKYNCHQ